jgi:hypothetical protein
MMSEILQKEQSLVVGLCFNFVGERVSLDSGIKDRRAFVARSLECYSKEVTT